MDATSEKVVAIVNEAIEAFEEAGATSCKEVKLLRHVIHSLSDVRDATNLSRNDIVRHVKSGGKTCPFCEHSGGVKRRGDRHIVFKCDLIVVGVECEACGKQWDNHYDLVGIEQ